MEVNEDIKLSGASTTAAPTPAPQQQKVVQETKVNDSDDLAKDWAVPTQEKTPGAVDNTQQPNTAGFDPTIAPEKDPAAVAAPIPLEEDQSLGWMVDSIVDGFSNLLALGSTAALKKASGLNDEDMATFRELIADKQAGKKKSVTTEYEEWVLKTRAKVEQHKETAPLSEDEKNMIKPPLKPLVKKWLEAMQQKASPGWALAIAVVPITVSRMAPAGGEFASSFLFSDKPTYARASEVTNEDAS